MASSFEKKRKKTECLILLFQFHEKLAQALQAVQNSDVGEDPAKAEGAMAMLDDFQKSIGIPFHPIKTQFTEHLHNSFYRLWLRRNRW